MPNIISFLIITVGVLFGIGSGHASNPLLEFGLLICLGYLFSLMMRLLRVPSFIGYILAGVLAGYEGLGFFHERFLSSMSLIEGLAMMLIVSHVARHVVEEGSLALFPRYFAIGIISSVGTMLLTLGFLAPFSIPVHAKIILGLFAATFSPLVTHAFTGDSESSNRYTQIALGGFVTAFVLWGVIMPFLRPSHPDRIKLVFMPVVIGITSLAAGFAWAFIAEKLLYRKSSVVKFFFPALVMFLIYPCCREIGLDYLFVAISAGIYYGLFSEHAEDICMKSELVTLLVFGFFGIKLSLTDTFFLGYSGWKLVFLLSLCIIFSRVVMLKISVKALAQKSSSSLASPYFIPGGPLIMIVLTRFLPGYAIGDESVPDKFMLLSLCTTSMILLLVISTFTHVMMRKRNGKQGTQLQNQI